MVGRKFNGNEFIEEAITKGAKIVISNEETGQNIVKLIDADLKEIYSLLCSAFYEKKPSEIIAVTGTNGKTSVVEFCRQIWNLAGWKAASLGTLGTITSDELRKENENINFTTLEPFLLHQELTNLHKKNVSHLALEASSHGLDQKRLVGIDFCGAVFTNLSHDHLDYHKTLKKYFESKKKLFTEHLKPGSIVSINLDDSHGLKIYNEIRNEPYVFINFGRHKNSQLRLIQSKHYEKTWDLKIKFKNHTIETSIGMLGEFQVYNALASAAICIGLNMDPNFVIKSLAYLKSVSGRMQVVDGHPANALIIIDYAHTPDALEKALKSLQLQKKGKLYTLFGCGGNRDIEKRKKMGEIAFKNSDFTIITDDNPRKEEPKKIRNDILSGCPDGIEIPGRDIAIRKAIKLLGKGDILLISGKGHETTQTIGTESLPFDDFSVARTEIENLVNE